jgi:N-dimethylarginine dimethylaminohydrolase
MTTTMPMSTEVRRSARQQHYLMCRPDFFSVTYAINPWMDPAVPVDEVRALAQWDTLRRTYESLGHQVDLIAAAADLPDMVFAANGGIVVDGRALAAHFTYAERQAEGGLYCDWFAKSGFSDARQAEHQNEGEGDFLKVAEIILAGTGFRTSQAAHREVAAFFGRTVVSLTLVDPRFYHLDTALAVLDETTVAYFPAAFSASSRRELERLFPSAIIATEADAMVFGLNAVSDGRNVILSEGATHLVGALRDRGYEPIEMDMSELRKAGGAVKCCTLELRS